MDYDYFEDPIFPGDVYLMTDVGAIRFENIERFKNFGKVADICKVLGREVPEDFWDREDLENEFYDMELKDFYEQMDCWNEVARDDRWIRGVAKYEQARDARLCG